MIERVTSHTFFYEKEHHPLRIKNDLRAPVENMKAVAPHSSPTRSARGRRYLIKELIEANNI
jgi:hypothetical protein